MTEPGYLINVQKMQLMLKCFVMLFPSTPVRQVGCGDCLADKREDYWNCSVLYC